MLNAAASVFPSARRFLVLNEAAGPFAKYERDPNFVAITKMPGVAVFTLAKCISAIWADIERDGLSFAQAIDLGPEEIGKTLGITRPWVAKRSVGDLGAWADKAVASLRPLFAGI